MLIFFCRSFIFSSTDLDIGYIYCIERYTGLGHGSAYPVTILHHSVLGWRHLFSGTFWDTHHPL